MRHSNHSWFRSLLSIHLFLESVPATTAYFSFPSLRGSLAWQVVLGYSFILAFHAGPLLPLPPVPPGLGRLGCDRNLFFKQNKNGLCNERPVTAFWILSWKSCPLGTVLLDVLGARERNGEGSARAGADGRSSFASRVAEPPPRHPSAPVGRFYSVSIKDRKYSIRPRVIQIALFLVFLMCQHPGLSF